MNQNLDFLYILIYTIYRKKKMDYNSPVFFKWVICRSSVFVGKLNI